MRLECRQTTYAQARDFYNQYEHLGCPGRGVYHWGAFNGDVMVACVSFGSACFGLHRGIFAEVSSRHALRVYQLTRGGTVPFAPKCTGSWIVSKGLKALRRLRGDCLVVAYSDTEFNEIGTIYQAANFLYLGMTNPKGQSDYVINRLKMSGWKVRRLFGTRDMKVLSHIDPKAIRLPLHRKHRYVFIVAKRTRREKVMQEFKELMRPYPKRHVEGVYEMNPMDLIRRRTNNPFHVTPYSHA